MNHGRSFVILTALALLAAGCSYGYAGPYNRYGSGPEITFSAAAPQGVR